MTTPGLACIVGGVTACRFAHLRSHTCMRSTGEPLHEGETCFDEMRAHLARGPACTHELVPARCHSGCTIDVAHCGACGMPAVERRGA